MNVMKEMSIKEGYKERDMEEGKEEKNTDKEDEEKMQMNVCIIDECG